MTIMPNNLDSMIARSGMSKREVAALKGITPETLSRQIHGKIQMTLVDAEYYAKILNCKPQDVLFAVPPVPIIGQCEITSDGVVSRNVGVKALGQVYTNFYSSEDTGFIHWAVADDYDGIWQYLRNGLESVLLEPIQKKYVHHEAKGHESFVMTEEPFERDGRKQNIAAGLLYPEPGNRYTIHNGDQNETLRSQKLVWATPTLAMVLRPRLRNFEIIYDK